MNTNYTALALVVDRSGSMFPLVDDVKGGVKQFIEEQKKNDGKASLTLSQFDHTYEVIYDFHDIQEVNADKFNKDYKPRGSTALLDAIGRATLSLNQKIESLPDNERPKRVIVAVITDGLENSSTEFNIQQIKEMIKQKEAAGWDFMFLGATLDTIQIAENMGFSAAKAATWNTSNADGCMGTISQKITEARFGREIQFDDEERSSLVKPLIAH